MLHTFQFLWILGILTTQGHTIPWAVYSDKITLTWFKYIVIGSKSIVKVKSFRLAFSCLRLSGIWLACLSAGHICLQYRSSSECSCLLISHTNAPSLGTKKDIALHSSSMSLGLLISCEYRAYTCGIAPILDCQFIYNGAEGRLPPGRWYDDNKKYENLSSFLL